MINYARFAMRVSDWQKSGFPLNFMNVWTSVLMLARSYTAYSTILQDLENQSILDIQRIKFETVFDEHIPNWFLWQVQSKNSSMVWKWMEQSSVGIGTSCYWFQNKQNNWRQKTPHFICIWKVRLNVKSVFRWLLYIKCIVVTTNLLKITFNMFFLL